MLYVSAGGKGDVVSYKDEAYPGVASTPPAYDSTGEGGEHGRLQDQKGLRR